MAGDTPWSNLKKLLKRLLKVTDEEVHSEMHMLFEG